MPERHPPERGVEPRVPAHHFVNFPMELENPHWDDVSCDDYVTLYTQYSTQWDALSHVGRHFDADGDGVAEPIYYNGYRAGTDVVGPEAKDGPAARSLGIEKMAETCVQGRGVLIDLFPQFGPDADDSSPMTTSPGSWRRRYRRRDRRHALLPHRLRTGDHRHGGQARPGRCCTIAYCALDGRDDRLSPMDRRERHLGPDRRQFRGRRLPLQGPRRCRALSRPADPPEMPRRSRHPSRRALVPERARRLSPGAKTLALPAHRPTAAPAGLLRLAGYPGRDGSRDLEDAPLARGGAASRRLRPAPQQPARLRRRAAPSRRIEPG